MGNEAGEAGAGKDLVQFYLGAQKVTLTDTDSTAAMDSNVQLGGTAVDDLFVDITKTTGSGWVKIDKIELIWAPEDEVFVTEEVSAALPGLESFRVEYAGMTHDGNEEKVIIEPHGAPNIQLTAPLEAGDTTVDVLFSATNPTSDVNFTALGESNTAQSGRLFVASGGTIEEGDFMVLTSWNERETHIVEFDAISNDNVSRLKDLADGTKYEGSCASVPCTINVGDVSAVFTAADPGSDNAVIGSASDIGGNIYTKEGLTIGLGGARTFQKATFPIYIVEEDQNGVLSGGSNFTMTMDVGSTGKSTVSAVDVSNVNYVTAPGSSTAQYQYGDSKEWGLYTTFGTRVVWDKSGDEYLVEIYYPGEQAHANVFVNSETAVVTEGGGGGTYEEVQRVEVEQQCLTLRLQA
jgi:hypothetical protein